MPATLIVQPAADSLNAAYRPLILKVEATPTTGTGWPPFVVCDVYINWTYYKSFVRTAPEALSAGGLPVYAFDIQDAVQEYLQPNLAAVNNAALLQAPHMSAKVICRFRASAKDTDGLTVEEGPKPIQRTRYTGPGSGGGTESNAFYVLNAALQHEDNQDLATHLASYRQGTWDQKAYPLTHRKNYFVCPDSSDHFPFAFNGTCREVSIVLHYRNRGSNVWNTTGGVDLASCPTISYDRTVVGNTVTVTPTQTLAPTESYQVRYKLQAAAVWTTVGNFTTASASFTVAAAGTYDLEVIRLCACCGNSAPTATTFTIAQAAPATAWRGISPFCELMTTEGSIYLALDHTRNYSENETWFPNSSAPISRTVTKRADLYVKFFSDAARLIPLTVNQAGMKIWVKKKTVYSADTYRENETLVPYTINAAGNEALLEAGAVIELFTQNFADFDPTLPVSNAYENYAYTPFPSHQYTGGNTGNQGYATLQQYTIATGAATGVTKPNASSDPDYIAPTVNTAACPIGPPYTTVQYGYGLDVRRVDMVYFPSSAVVASAPAVADTGAGGYAYILPLDKDKLVAVTIKTLTRDSGNTTGVIKVRLQLEDGTTETFDVGNGQEQTLPARKAIKIINISNY